MQSRYLSKKDKKDKKDKKENKKKNQLPYDSGIGKTCNLEPWTFEENDL